MDPVEKAIRNALEKGNAGDRAFREKVYRSAFAALERATKSQPQLTVEQAIRRRQNLQARITAIEAEYLPAPPDTPITPEGVADELVETVRIERDAGAAPSIEAPSVDDPGQGEVAPEVSPINQAGPPETAPSVDLGMPGRDEPVLAGAPAIEVAHDRRPQERSGPDLVAPDLVAPDLVATDPNARRPRRRRPFAAMFMILTFLCVVAIGGWWAYKTGLLDGYTGSGPVTPPQLVEEEDFDPGEQGPAQPGDLGGSQELRQWITVFSPRDPSGVNAPTGASADISEDESGQFIRIRSGSGGADVIFDVGQGVLEQIAGKKAVFDISARAEDGTQTQISVSCDFGEMGDCGRKRYAVGYERGEFLFDVSLPSNRPGAGGSIAINSDFANEGRAVDIYEIKVSVLE
ncbi:MAG: hypothetical protein KF810_17295 [Rhizobiaceae bacterium]|nr:hypothetical protein [Rhizobiaceae bacterium]